MWLLFMPWITHIHLQIPGNKIRAGVVKIIILFNYDIYLVSGYKSTGNIFNGKLFWRNLLWEMSHVRVLQYSCHGKYTCSIPNMFGMSLHWQSITGNIRSGLQWATIEAVCQKHYIIPYIYIIRWCKMGAILHKVYSIAILLIRFVVFCGNVLSNHNEFMCEIYIM